MLANPQKKMSVKNVELAPEKQLLGFVVAKDPLIKKTKSAHGWIVL